MDENDRNGPGAARRREAPGGADRIASRTPGRRDQQGPGVVATIACRSDIGPTRRSNDDTCGFATIGEGGLVAAPFEAEGIDVGGRGLLLLVADGVGSSKAGGVASRMAAEKLVATLARDGKAALSAAVRSVNAEVHAAASSTPGLEGMTTTLTAATLRGDRLTVAHVGDSRLYIIRGGEIWQATSDQTLARALFDRGSLTSEEAERSSHRHILMNAIGAEPTVEPEVVEVALAQGDTILLCSDGLSNALAPDEIRAVVNAADSLALACEQLEALANARSGSDNVSVVAARVDGAALPAPSALPSPLAVSGGGQPRWTERITGAVRRIAAMFA